MSSAKYLSPILIMIFSPASSHDFWMNGEPVPKYVKQACCGVSDAHHLKKSALHLMADGWHIEGITTVVPAERATPSPDGEAWAFWNVGLEPSPVIYCLFVPFQGT